MIDLKFSRHFSNRLQNRRFLPFSEGARRRKRDPRVIPRRFYTRSRPFVWILFYRVACVRKKYDCFAVYFSNQSEVKPKTNVARVCTFSRALCRLRVITSSFDWLTGLSPSFLIGQSNYFGFGFTTLDWNSLKGLESLHIQHYFVLWLKLK